MIVRRLPSDELYHHGIKNQQWGDRNGPPYPLDRQTSAAVKKGVKKKNFIERARDKYRMKKVRRAKIEKANEQKRINEEKAERLRQAAAERKERAEVIKTGSAKDIQKFQHKMSDKEYEQALKRIDLTQKLNDAVAAQSEAKSKKMKARLDTVMNTAKTIGDIAESAGKVYNTLEKFGVVKKSDTTSSLESKVKKYESLSKISKAKKEIFENDKFVETKGDFKTSVSNSDIAEIKKMVKEIKDRE